MQSHIIHYTACPVCGSSDISRVLSAKDYTVSGELYEIWECRSCTVRFTQDAPALPGIHKYYKAEQYVSHTDTNKGLINKMYHIVRQRTLKQKLTLISRESGLDKGALLDIGAGVGAFAALAQNAGWKVTALEPEEEARQIARQKFGIELHSPAALQQLSPESMDVITLWHVLEHVHSLADYIEKCREIMKPKGVLIIAVPNYTSYDAAVYQEHWAAYDVPRHLYHFSPQSMQKLMQLHHLQVVKMLPMKYDSYYVSMLSEKYKNGRNNLPAAFKAGLRSNALAKGNAAKYSSVIYVIRKA